MGRSTYRVLATTMVAALCVACISVALEYNPVTQCETKILREIPDNPGVRRGAIAVDRVVSAKRAYHKGDLSLPELVYLDNGRVQTLALVYKPENWDELEPEKRKAIVTLHEHCGNAANHFDVWQELGEKKGMAVISLQWWLEDNLPPKSYTVFYDRGNPCGYCLDLRQDIFPFMDALLDEYGVESVMIHGYAVSAPMGVNLTYRDKLKSDRIDMSLFNAGHIESANPLRRELAMAFRARPDSPPLQGENFFFYYDSDVRRNDTHKFLAEQGGSVVEVVTGNGQHGVLFTSKSDDLRERIVDKYDEIATIAIRARKSGGKHAAAK